MSTFSSRDFAKVPSHLTSKIPDKLIHKNVLNCATSDDEEIFSKDREHLVKIVDLPSKTISMTIGGLAPRENTRKHRHNYETVIYILSGEGKTVISDRDVIWGKGDAIYIPIWAWHQHFNLSSTEECLYVACENAALLQNLGEIALREEE